MLLLLCFLIAPGHFASANESPNRNEVLIYTDRSAAVEAKSIIAELSKDLTASITVSYGVQGGELLFGNLFSVLNCSNLFYMPVYYNNKCICIVKILDRTGDVVVSYCNDNCNVINALKPGEYVFINCNDDIYLASESSSYCFESKTKCAEKTLPTLDVNTLPKELECVELSECIKKYPVENTKSILSKELSTVPYIANGGTYGYCWLSSAVSVCRYYGSNVSLSDAHTFIHGLNHTLSLCPGGSIISSYGVIHNYTGLDGSYSYDSSVSRINAANAYASIYNDTPIYSSWKYYENGNLIDGHAMVICGYIFNNSSGSFTYVLMDPNNSSRQYLLSTYTASTISYTISNHNYNWEMAIYDWN